MKSIIYTHKLRFSAIFVAVSLLVATLLFVFVAHVGATDSTPSGGRLVTIHDRGIETTILSKGDTIADALAEADVTLDKSDTVEPAVTDKLVASEYQVNIYRARPVIVIDGATKQKIITPYQTATQIAETAGITLYDEDVTTLARTDNIVAEGAGLKLTITRATPFVFTLYGKVTDARTQGKTVGEMLKAKGITLAEDDRVAPVATTPLTEGLVVRVWREGKQTVTVEESVNFTLNQIQDGDQYVGYQAVKIPGEVGARTVTYEIEIQDGKEVGRKEIASITTREPVAQVDIIGAKYRGAYTTPTENEVISWNFFIARGFTREQTAGIMGNLMQEHRFNTTGDGLAQWTGGRKTALLSRADPYNIYTQLQFLMDELNGGYASVQTAIRSSTSVEDAVIIFQDRFERCGICMQSNRVQYAYNILASH